MDAIPFEVIDTICRQLCFHCQHRTIFPNADSDIVRQHKATLSRLCRTSKRIRTLAQPILYHYFATGNLPKTPGFGLSHLIRGPLEDDKLPMFLRTALKDPGLALQVRALQLVDSDDVQPLPDDFLRHLENKAEVCNIQDLAVESVEPCSQWLSRYQLSSMLEDHRWLELAVALSPNLEMLFVAHTGLSRFFEESHVVMSKLRTLALCGYSGAYYFFEATPLIAAAPELHELYLLDCLHFKGWTQKPQLTSAVYFKPVLANIRRLVISGPTPEHLEELLGFCHQLEDLEYYEQRSRNVLSTTQLVQALRPLRKTLQRLYFTYLPPESPCSSCHRLSETVNNEQCRHYVECSMPQRYDTSAIESLQDFERLVELGIDQASIYSPMDTAPDICPGRLARLLPPLIRKLRIMYVYRDMRKDILDMCQKVQDKYRDLKLVRLGQSQCIAPWRRAGLEEMHRIHAIPAVGGKVSISWTIDQMGGDARTRIPGGTVFPQFTSCPVD